MQYKNRVLTATIAFLIAFTLGGCSRARTRLPLEEIKRPISLPLASGRIGLDWRALINTEIFSLYERRMQPIVIYPYFPLGNRWELYMPGFFRYYLIKNTLINGNTFCISGPNAAVHGGWAGVLYQNNIGFMFEFMAGWNYKHPLNDRLWFASDLQLVYETNTNIYGGWVQAGFGCQISHSLYATLKPSYSIFNPYVNEGYPISFPEITRYFTLPLLLGVNLTRTSSLYWQSGIVYYRNYNVRYLQNFGFHFTW